MSKKLVIITTVAVIVALGLGIYQLFIKDNKLEFALAKVSRETILKEVSETGTVKANEEIDLNFKTSGKIEAIYVKVGEEVEVGQQLAKLDVANLSIQLKEAQAALQVIQAKKADAGVSLESARQNLADVIAVAEEDLNNAYEDALDILDDAYLEIYNSYSVIYDIKETYFPLVSDQEAMTVANEENNTKSYLEEAEIIVDGVGSNSQKEEIDSALSEMREILDKMKDSLEAIRGATESSTYYSIVSSTRKTSLDTHKAYVIDINTTVVSSQQTISTTKVDNETNINTAEAQVSLLENQLEGTQDGLYQAQIDQAQAKISLLENQIQDAYLRSPVQGKVTAVDKKAGEVVQSTEAVVSLLSTGPFQIKADIYEEDVVAVEIGNSVQINLVAFPDEILEGRVVLVDPGEKLINDVVYYEVTIDFTGAKEGIKHGMTADIIIEVDKKENVLAVPKKAVKKMDGERTVQVYKDGVIEERKVEIGLEGGEFSEIISGLKEGEQVVTGKAL